MAYSAYYRTSDGLEDYLFEFVEHQEGIWRAYILEMPSYGSRSSDAHTTHRLSDGGRRYICWNRPVNSYEDMRQIAALWADHTQQYIRFGERF